MKIGNLVNEIILPLKTWDLWLNYKADLISIDPAGKHLLVSTGFNESILGLVHINKIYLIIKKYNMVIYRPFWCIDRYIVLLTYIEDVSAVVGIDYCLCILCQFLPLVEILLINNKFRPWPGSNSRPFVPSHTWEYGGSRALLSEQAKNYILLKFI